MLKINITKTVIILTVSVILLITIMVLSQTVLFTWSPLRIGYNRFRFDMYDVYTDKSSLNSVFNNLDKIITSNEIEHGLKYNRKNEIIICGVKKLIYYIPWMNCNSAAGIWPHTVYLSDYLIDKSKNPILLIKHELSHLLLLQNYGEPACAAIWKHNEWLPEGLAVYITGGYPGFLSKEEVLTAMNENGIDFQPYSSGILFGKDIRDMPVFTRYQIYYHFVCYLIDKYDRETFFSFLYDTFDRSQEIDDSFFMHFNISFGKSLREFYEYLTE